jgi:hypothetical protein
MNAQNNFSPEFVSWDFFGIWVLEFGASLELGSWCLVLRPIAIV